MRHCRLLSPWLSALLNFFAIRGGKIAGVAQFWTCNLWSWFPVRYLWPLGHSNPNKQFRSVQPGPIFLCFCNIRTRFFRLWRIGVTSMKIADLGSCYCIIFFKSAIHHWARMLINIRLALHDFWTKCGMTFFTKFTIRQMTLFPNSWIVKSLFVASSNGLFYQNHDSSL